MLIAYCFDTERGLNMKKTDNIFYSLGNLGKEISFGMINVYAMLFMTTFVGLNGVVVGFAFCAVRLISAIFDPFMATIVNNTKSKLGKYRPWLIIGSIFNAVTLLLLFVSFAQNPNFSTGVNYVYYLSMYLIWNISYTIVDVPFMSMLPSLADTTKEREAISSLSKLIGGFGGLIIGSGGQVLISTTFGAKDPKSYLLVAGVGGVIFVTMMILSVVTLKERYDLPFQEISFKDIKKMYQTNDQVQAFAGSYLFFNIAANTAILQLVYLFIYDKNLDFNYFIVFNVVASTGQGIAMIFYSMITKKIPREKIFGLTYLFAGIGMISIYAISFVFPYINSAIANVILMSLCGSFLMIAMGMNQITSTVMIADVVDYGEYKTGIRSDSIMISVQTLLLKVSAAIAVLIIGIGVAVAQLPQIDLMTNEFTGEVTNKMLVILRTFMFIVPLPLIPIGYIYYKKKYKLYGQFYLDVKAEIDSKRSSKLASFSKEETKVDNID